MSRWQSARMIQGPAFHRVGDARRQRRQSALTLVEILVVVVILGLVSVIGGSSLIRRIGADPVGATIAEIANSWHRFHLLASERSGGEVDVTGGRMRMRLSGKTDEVIFNPDLQVTWWSADGHQSHQTLIYDARGRSEDVLVRVRLQGRTEEIFLSGLTGAIKPAAPPTVPPPAVGRP